MDKLPYLTAALLCEKVLEEKSGTLSAVRIIDRLEYELQTNVPELAKLDIKPIIPFTALICLKSGPVVGKVKVSFDGIRPSGKSKRLITLEVDLKGGDQGQNLVLNMGITVEEEGLHWFEVRVDEALLTKIPLMLVPKPVQVLNSPAPQETTDHTERQ